jgi:glutamyl endopeptidase
MHSIRSTLVLAAVAAVTATGAVASDVPVASDGSNYSYRGAPIAASPPTLGSGTVSRAAAEAAGASFDEPAEAAPSDGLASVAYGNPRAGRQGRSIVGWDSRMRAYPTGYPNRAIALITRNGSHHCTGWFISANTIATAGHCVHSGGTSGSWYAVNTLRVYPGYDGTGAGPFGSCTVRRSHSVSGWLSSRNADYDYGAMRLNCNLGSLVGTFGYYAPSQASLFGQTMIISGYPGDKPRTQWLSSDKIRAVSNFRVFYRADTVGGHSGSPIWNDRGEGLFTTGAWAYAVHAYGANSQNMNSAPWLSSVRVSNYNAWRTAP